ncbi:MAG: DUF937 domain-containing protein [Pseudomonadota bacterium]
MSLLKTILESQGGAVAGQLAKQFGLDANQASSVLNQLVPALSAGVKRNTSQQSGLDGLIGALTKGNHQRYLDDASHVSQQATVDDGNKILGHLFGSKDVSRQVATRAAEQTGVSSSVLKKMLPVVATMVMGGLSKQSNSGAGGALAGLLGGGQQQSAGQSLLTSFLDSDGDGSVADDLLGMLMKR